MVAATSYDVLSARIVEEAGFDAVFCSGYGHAASALGAPDDGSLTLGVLADRVAAVTKRVAIPVLVDADTGFDDPRATVGALAEAGASAVMIEDQIPAKRCGHLPGKHVVPLEEMCERLASALAGRPPGVAVIARTDAIEPYGLDEAIRRARAFAEAGADVVFVEAPESVTDLRTIARSVPRPAMVNLLPGGKTPELPVAELVEIGFGLIVFGLVDLMLATAALRSGLRELVESGDLRWVTTPRSSFETLNALTGAATLVDGSPPQE